VAVRFTVAAAGQRADKFLAEQLEGRGRRALAEAFEAGQVRVNGKRAKKGHMLAAGDVVELEGLIAPPGGVKPVPEPDAPLVTVHVDARLVVVNKAAGAPTHPLEPAERGTVANAVVGRWPECAAASQAPREGGAAHRLDAGTTGLLVFARDREAWKHLRAAFHEGRVKKEYLALVVGEVTRAGEIDLPIAQHGARAQVSLDGMAALPATTRFAPEKRYRGYTLLRCRAETGRMHQVRVHLAYLDTPIVGDATYGRAEDGFAGHFLHAARLTLPHPDGGREVTYEAPLPADRAAFLAGLPAL
jgi:23S rRNA pseudouridine1911/1915/1917 synthase